MTASAAPARRQVPLALPPDRPVPGDVAGDVGTRELLAMVDEETERLPASVRAVVVLCCLEGRTRDEAADRLGVTVAAVKGRLERGRELLRRRLARRGVALPAAFLVLSLTGERVGAAVQARAVQAALGTAPPAVAALAAVAVPAIGQWTLLALAAVVAAGVAGVATFAGAGAGPQTPPAALPPAVAADDAPPRDRYGDPLPDGAVRRFGTVRFRHAGVFQVRFTPGGKELIAGCGRS